MKNLKLFYGISIGMLVGFGAFIIDKESTIREASINKLIIPKAKDTTSTRGYNFNTKSGEYYNYSDEEIRMIREKASFESEGRYYIKTPGRYVPSYQEEFEQRMEQYIEDNFDEILDEYGD